tara:strand:+ start:3119 stop:3718 length:600 start_codon:yes stop_codon:yes gene_type:complete
MFTGIIQALGNIKSMKEISGDFRCEISIGSLDISDLDIGSSISVNGVCLTAIQFTSDSFIVDISNETLSLTSLGDLHIGSSVNLEKSLTLSSSLGGHLVSGHVDGLGVVLNREKDARSIRFDVSAPSELLKYIAQKGSIAVDGVSLTVNSVNGKTFTFNVVPHTLKETILSECKEGSKVNLEVDLLARYLERLITNKET